MLPITHTCSPPPFPHTQVPMNTLKIIDTTTHHLPVSHEGPGTMNTGLGGSNPDLGQAACSESQFSHLKYGHHYGQCGTSQVVLMVKNAPCQCRRHKRRGFNPWVRRIPWRREWQPSPVFLPGESHGQRSLAGYSPLDRRVRRD